MNVSIVIPTYRRADYLDRLLASITRQTFRGFEIIVVDDHSPEVEAYARVVEKYAARFPAFTFLRNASNMGAPHSRNRGIEAAAYPLIALVDDDDEWLPEKLEKQVTVFRQSGAEVGLVYTWADAVDASGQVVHRYRSEIEGQTARAILRSCFIPSPSVMVTKAAMIEAGMFDESFPSCQDWDMWTRIVLKGYAVRVVKEVLAIYHQHGNASIGLSENARQGYRMYYRKHLMAAIRYLNIKNIYRYVRMRKNG